MGAKTRKDERKLTEKPSTENRKGNTGNRVKQKGKRQEVERQKASTWKATVRRNREEQERKKQRLSSQNPKLKRTKESENSGGQKVDWIATIGRVKVRPRERSEVKTEDQR